VPLDVRIVSATNTDLAERIAEGRFRQDLYFRLAGYTLHVPALRDRRGDIPALVEHFVARHTAAIGKRIRGVSRKALAALVDAPWPGNVRELESEVRRFVYLCHEGDLVTSALLSPALQELAQAHAGAASTGDSLDIAVHTEALQRRLVTAALERSGGKVAAAARLLGLSRYGLTLMMRRLSIHAADQ
jgi:two-component system response regulator HupR/HoxA